MKLKQFKKTVVLVMVVKNEAKHIAATIKSTLPLGIGAAVILDNDSTDSTRKVAAATLNKYKVQHWIGGWYADKFIEAEARNHALQKAADYYGKKRGLKWALLLDGDNVLDVQQPQLARDLLAKAKTWTIDLEIHLHGGDQILSYPQNRITRLDPPVLYGGKTHTTVASPDPLAKRLPGVTLQFKPTDGERRAQRRLLDIEQCEQQIKENPKDPRPVYYRAQSLMDLGRWAEAIEGFEDRISMGGWWEERFESLLHRGECLQMLRPTDPTILATWLEAHALAPHRAEPLYLLARYYRGLDKWAPTWLFASEAARLSPPVNDRLFVRLDVYQWRAADLAAQAGFYLSKMNPKIFQQAKAFASKALIHCPDSAYEYLAKNLAYFG